MPTLPEWDLSDLYASIDSKLIQRDLDEAEKQATAFQARYTDKVATLDAKAFAEAIKAYEQLQDLMGKLGSYAQLVYAKETENPAVAQFYQNMVENLTVISTKTLFFTLSINAVDDAQMMQWLTDEGVSHYASWLRDVRNFRPYQLSQELETLLHEKHVSGAAAWTRLFDETMAGLRFNMGRKTLTEAEAFNLLSSRNAEERRKAALSIGDVLEDNAKTFALITNTLAKDKAIEDKWRGFEKPISSRNVSNFIENEVVDALIHAVQSRYGTLSHRYYALKAGWFGKKVLPYWDRNAPLPFDANIKYSWKEAEDLVLHAYASFSKELAHIGKRFFDNRWIDAPVVPGKSSGAFAHPTVPSAHPYLLLNFQGKARDVMTLAHELGHGVHQVLSAKQGALMADTPLTLAETASVFGEQLTFQAMLAKESTAKKRKSLIASKVEDMLNTVVRQVAFCAFETKVHDERRKGELSVEQLCDIWMQVQEDSLGSAIALEGNYKYFWTYIPHFIHSPFYVYAYAFGDCLVNSLYAAYKVERDAGNADAFARKYITMLEAGGTLRHKELLAPFGLDATDPQFWHQGLDVIETMIDELETL